jgi:hypothetical protein
MMRLRGACAFLLLASGCLVADDTVPPGTGMDLLGRVCTTQLTVTGSFMQTMERPTDPEDGSPYTGCWPIGVWTFQAQIAENDCATPPQLLPQYQFRVEQRLDEDGNPYQVNTYMTEPNARHRIKVSQGGSGLCTGELNLFSPDGKEVWIIKPTLHEGNAMAGDGEYALYRDDQWIGDAD